MTKPKIIKNIDHHVPIDDIANSLGLDLDELIDDIESIVYSGTKLNIDYILEDVLDDDQIMDIYNYFRESETDRLSVAMEELGGDYEEYEVRLVRIKFLSEMAN